MSWEFTAHYKGYAKQDEKLIIFITYLFVFLKTYICIDLFSSLTLWPNSDLDARRDLEIEALKADSPMQVLKREIIILF